MGILKKHQLKGAEGFKRLVRNLEGMNVEKRDQLIELISLEDPIYSLWVMKNLYDIKIIFDKGSAYFPDLYEMFKEKLDIFIKAFHGSEFEESFLKDLLDPKLHTYYHDQCQYEKSIPQAVRNNAQKQILEKFRDLQEREVIRDVRWELPGEKVLKGITDVPQSGAFKMYYSKDMIALEGEFQEKLREGQWRHYYPQNRLMAEGWYHQSEKVDDWTFYYPSGQKKASGQYVDDLKEGEWLLWDENGIETKVLYERGRLSV